MTENTVPAAPVAPATPVIPALPAVPAIEAAIAGWFNDHIVGSPVAKSVDAYNHLRSALGALSAAIAAVTGGHEQSEQPPSAAGEI
jgi:hypothetical protein